VHQFFRDQENLKNKGGQCNKQNTYAP